MCSVDMWPFVSYSNYFSPGAGWHADPCVQLQHLGASPHVWGPLWLHPLHRCPSDPALHPHQQWYASKLTIFSLVNILDFSHLSVTELKCVFYAVSSNSCEWFLFLHRWHVNQTVGLGEEVVVQPGVWGSHSLCHADCHQPQGQQSVCQCLPGQDD